MWSVLKPVLHRQADRTQTHRYYPSPLLLLLLATHETLSGLLDTGATYHVCPNRDWFSSFEKQDGCFAIMGDDHPCKVEGIGTVRIKMFDGMVRELKEVRYVPQVKKNLISIGALETLGHGVFVRDGILKMTKSSMVVLKGVRRNNLYYLMGDTVTKQVVTFTSSGDICTQV